MYSQRRTPPPLKRSNSGASHNSHGSHGSAATTVSRSSSKLLFGEIPLSPVTSADGRSIPSNGSICNLVLSTSSVFLRFWLNDDCRENVLNRVESEDLANLRLVCHDFSSKAAPRLFEKMTVTFKTSTFTKPARMEALSRIGRHVKTFTFYMPHSPETCLPPIIDPLTGTEKQFLYEPQVQVPQCGPAKDKAPKYGSWEMQDLLIKQYPPLFHAATNVPAFCAAFSELINLTHLKVSCPGSSGAHRHRRGVVDYALISLRIAIERAPLYSLSALSLLPIHPGGLLYLHPMHGLGSTPSSAKRWRQIRRLAICMESVPFASTSLRTRTQSLEHLRILHAYLATLSRNLTRVFFRWKGARGPSPLSLDLEPCMLPAQDQSTQHPSLRTLPNGPRPLTFPRLRIMELENAIMDSYQITDFILKHNNTLREFNFEDVKLREGDWDIALEPLTWISGSDSWKQYKDEVMDVPIMLSPVEIAAPPPLPSPEPRIMGHLMQEVESAIEMASGRERREHALSRWLGRPRQKSGMAPGNKDSFWGGSKRLLHLSGWKQGGGAVMAC
ncbi:hypothetical protein COCVIDRAFT_38821 [Bipolaris victoriae FI3]|uniref:F-box domain-containing protein n=1 Tax=Bipolaris victoriae (strain FI3) TaxID=930091 RepID=W7E5Z5_BIPV3|nr:hypothetical protein COCVIDRAFT_38821 [Bipolaris victoriae FI3]